MLLGKVSLLALSFGALAFASPAMAQDAPPVAPAPDAAGEASSGGLQDIVVTARRTSESLQKVPVAVTAISGDFLDRQNIQDVTSIPQLAPRQQRRSCLERT